MLPIHNLYLRCDAVPGPDSAHTPKASLQKISPTSRTPEPWSVTHSAPGDFMARVTSYPQHQLSLSFLTPEITLSPNSWDLLLLAELCRLGSWNVTNSYNFLLSAGCSYQICSWNHYLTQLHTILEAICGKDVFTKVTKWQNRGLKASSANSISKGSVQHLSIRTC